MPDKPRFRRWTADTETAFLMALRVTGSVTRACAEIGRSTHGAGDRRRRLPEFAAKWQAVLDEWQAEQAAERLKASGADDPGLMPNRVRYDGWTPLRQRAFLRALTETGKIGEACRKVGISAQSARKMRRMHPEFAEAWDRAMYCCDADLEQIALERAIDGIEEPVFHAGKVVGTRRRYSDPLMRKMIDVRARKAAEEAEAQKIKDGLYIPRATEEETNAAIFKKLDAIERRMRAQAAEEAARLLEAGLVP